MPSQHVPEKSWLQTLRKKVATGRTTAMKGRVGRELTEEEKRECAEQLAAMEEKRKRGIQSRKEARETLQNSRDLKEGQAELKQGQDEIKGAIGRVEQKFDQLLGAAGSSKHHREMAKEAAKREREEAKAAAKCERQEAKERQLLRAGLQVEDGDRVVDGVLVKAGLPLEGFEGLDLGAKFFPVKGNGGQFLFQDLNALGLQKITAYVPSSKRCIDPVIYTPEPGTLTDNDKPLTESTLVRLEMSSAKLLEQLELPSREPSPKRRRTEDAEAAMECDDESVEAAAPAEAAPAEAAPAEAAPAEAAPAEPAACAEPAEPAASVEPAPAPTEPAARVEAAPLEPARRAVLPLPENTPLSVHGVHCSYLGGGFVEVVEVQKWTSSSEQPAEQPVEQPEQPAEQPAEQPEQPAEQPAEQPVEQPEQPVEQPEEKPEESECSSTRAETEPAAEEPQEAGAPAVLPALAPLRVFGEKGFDIHMRGGPYVRVLGDLYHAGQVLEKLDFE
ncbi:zmpB, partial [Symbiodinium sp. KB8]